MAGQSLSGFRVLVVEDDPLVGMLLKDILDDEQCVVLGPHATVAEAMEAICEEIDLALLDVSLEDGKVYPVAEILSERNVPFVLLSGHGEAGVPADRAHWHSCAKPFSSTQLIEAMRALWAKASV